MPQNTFQPSYQLGFAPRDFEPKYPALWRGCTSALCPSLGPTGARLFDWAGRRQHGTLNGFTLSSAWAIQSQRYMIDHTGSNGLYTTAPSVTNDYPFTMAAWFVSDITTLSRIMCLNQVSAALNVASILIEASVVKLQAYNGTANSVIAGATSISAGVLYLIVGVFASATSRSLYLGSGTSAPKLEGSSSTSVVFTLPIPEIEIGAILFPVAQQAFDGRIGNSFMWNRGLTESEIQLLWAVGPDGMLMPDDQRSYSAGANVFNRRRRLLIGSAA